MAGKVADDGKGGKAFVLPAVGWFEKPAVILNGAFGGFATKAE